MKLGKRSIVFLAVGLLAVMTMVLANPGQGVAATKFPERSIEVIVAGVQVVEQTCLHEGFVHPPRKFSEFLLQ